MANIGYKRLKSIVTYCMSNKVFQEDNIVSYYTDMTKSSVRAALTKLKKVAVLISDSSQNKFNDTLIDKTYFTDSDYNAMNIASLLTHEGEVSKDIFKYQYNEVPKNVVNATTHQYTCSLNKELIHLIDYEKYQTFVHIISIVKNSAQKPIYELRHLSGDKRYCVPLEIFIHNGSSYLLVYDINKKQFDSLILHNTASVRLLTKTYDNPISIQDIKKALDEAVGLNYFITRELKQVTGEFLIYLKELELIEEYEFMDSSDELVCLKFMRFQDIDSKPCKEIAYKEFKGDHHLQYKYDIKIRTTAFKYSYIMYLKHHH